MTQFNSFGNILSKFNAKVLLVITYIVTVSWQDKRANTFKVAQLYLGWCMALSSSSEASKTICHEYLV